jgi:Flp pilus assembly pilin Flp
LLVDPDLGGAIRGHATRVGQSTRGQGLVEYGLIIALVAVLAIAGLIIFGAAVSTLLSNLGGSV